MTSPDVFEYFDYRNLRTDFFRLAGEKAESSTSTTHAINLVVQSADT